MRRLWFTAFTALAVWQTAGAVELSPADQANARKLYNTKCARCHKFYDPAKYSDAEWSGWMQKMNKKAKLKDAQVELLGRYLDGFRAATTTKAGPEARTGK